MSDAGIGAILGGIAGGAAGWASGVKTEAEEARKRSYQELVHQYGMENIKLQDQLLGERQKDQDGRNKQIEIDKEKRAIANIGPMTKAKMDAEQASIQEKADYIRKTQGEKAATNFLNNALDTKDKTEEQIKLAQAQAKAQADHRDNTSQEVKSLKGYVDMYGPEEGKKMFEKVHGRDTRSEAEKTMTYLDSKLGSGAGEEYYKNIHGGGAKGQLTASQKIEATSKLREEYALDDKAKPKDGGFFGKDTPGMSFDQWLKSERPEAYSVLYGGQSKPGLIEKAITPESSKSEQLSAKTEQPAKEPQSKSMPSFKPGQIVEQNGKKYQTDEKGIPKLVSAQSGQTTSQQEPAMSDVDARLAELDKQKEGARGGLISSAGLGEVVNFGKEAVNAGINQAKTAGDIYMALVGEPFKNLVTGMLSAQEKTIALRVLDDRYKNGQYTNDEYKKALSLLSQ